MSAASETKKLSLKLMVDGRTNEVVFAEADKCFVDFLCDILSMPVNTMVEVLNDGATVLGSLSNIYKSIEALGQDYIMPSTKDSVLKPKGIVCVPLLSVSEAPPTLDFYGSSCSRRCFTHSPTELCPCGCGSTMYKLSYRYVKPKALVKATSDTGNGHVREVVKYMVLDNLEVKPLTMAHIRCHVEDVASLKERDVEVGYDEGIAILKASFQTQAVLTDVFLGTKAVAEECGRSGVIRNPSIKKRYFKK